MAGVLLSGKVKYYGYYVHYLLLIKRCNLFKVLACSTTFFHLSLFYVHYGKWNLGNTSLFYVVVDCYAAHLKCTSIHWMTETHSLEVWLCCSALVSIAFFHVPWTYGSALFHHLLQYSDSLLLMLCCDLDTSLCSHFIAVGFVCALGCTVFMLYLLKDVISGSHYITLNGKINE